MMVRFSSAWRARAAGHPSALTARRSSATWARTGQSGSVNGVLAGELSALVLGRVKADAENHLGGAVDSAIITVPAYFNDKQRKATRRAGELAGLKVDRLINEPTAAALAYASIAPGRDPLFGVRSGRRHLRRLGAGDIRGRHRGSASTGDSYLGGEDFNEVLIRDMLGKFGGSWASRRASRTPCCTSCCASKQSGRGGS